MDWRKGPDLFAQVANEVIHRVPEARFFWIGLDTRCEAGFRAKALATDPRIRFIGERETPRDYLALGTAFFLSSREDPFPLVALEAADAGLPAVCFAGAGGMPEFIGNSCGRTVPFEDVEAAAKALTEILTNDPLRESLGRTARESVRAKHDAAKGSEAVLSVFERVLSRKDTPTYAVTDRSVPQITAVVPNYNCAPFLKQRLESIVRQTCPLKEILILDDASSDSSLEIASRFASTSPIPCRLLKNEKNSGSPYIQWQRGLQEAATDLVWIAEADDFSDSRFLEKLLPHFQDKSVVLAYSQTQTVQQNGDLFPGYFGKPLFEDEARRTSPALTATDSIDKNRWLKSYCVDGTEEIARGLGFQNTIPNGSATLVRRIPALEAIQKAQGFKNVGDWAFYLGLAKKGKVAYEPLPLNFFRRHQSSTTQSNPIQVLRESLEITLDLIEEGLLPLNDALDSIHRRFLEYDWELRSNSGRPRLHRHPQLQDIAEKLRTALFRLMPQSETPTILVLLPDAETGGGQTAAVRLANEFAKTHRVFVVNARPRLDDGNLSAMISDRIAFLEGRLCSLAHLRFCSDHPGIYETDLSPIRVSSLSALCDWLGIEVAFSHIWWADKLAHKLMEGGSMRWFLHMHGCYEFLIQNQNIDPSFINVARDIFENTECVLYAAKKNLAIFDHLPVSKPKLHFARYGFELPISFNTNNNNADFKVQPDEILFCMCARGIPEKGWEQAIGATLCVNQLPPAQRGYKKARLVTIGSSEYLDSLLKKYDKHPEITSMGLQRSPVEIMRHCHVGLLPTYFVSESQPNVVIEYMAAGLAVIATAIGAIPDMIYNNGVAAGIALDYSDKTHLIEDLTVEMARLMREANLLRDRRCQAKRIFKSRYDICQVAAEIVSIFKCNKSAQPPSLCESSTKRISVIAIHLPQFHPFKENNEWWGEGFTEWTNVRKARPLFPGHTQPRVPTDLGYYDLRSSEVRAAQAKLARDHGIDGFCYYHYWFHGHRLMTEPLDAIFESGEPDFPFCLCWANETWSRRWLGEERDVLIAQTYSEADNFNHAHFLAKVFLDKRHIRIDNRPLFMIYRPTHIDVLEHFLTTLRKVCIDAGTGDPFILGCSAHAEGTDMRTLGLDGTMDFQPKLGFLPGAFEDHSSPERLARNRALGVDSPNLRLYDARDFRRRIEEYRDQLDYPFHPSVFVSWDNTPRRKENGIILINNTAEGFGKSLESARQYLQSSKFPGEKILFINAWNEWAEGNYLEPDQSQQAAFLEQVNPNSRTSRTPRRKSNLP
jgi:glycosyltransferase involved in cell wall biosynthesis